MKSRGFTLIELLIGTAIGSGILLTAVAFSSQQMRAVALTEDAIEVSEASRYGLDRLSADVRMAGAGVGSSEAGDFVSLARGTFQVGAATFVANNRVLDNGARTDDLALLSALGGRVSIAAYDESGWIEACARSGFEPNDLLVLRSEDGLSALSVRASSIVPTTCGADTCVKGCERINWAPDATFSAGPSALTASYAGGVVSGRLQWVTWFVDDSDPNNSRLRRAEGPCAQRDATCGDVVAEHVETLQVRRWAQQSSSWVDITDDASPIAQGTRLRLDVELILRARKEDENMPMNRTVADLETGECYPDCAGPADRVLRRRVSTSVEVKNSGRGSYGRQR